MKPCFDGTILGLERTEAAGSATAGMEFRRRK
jgi:hypothetical protein